MSTPPRHRRRSFSRTLTAAATCSVIAGAAAFGATPAFASADEPTSPVSPSIESGIDSAAESVDQPVETADLDIIDADGAPVVDGPLVTGATVSIALPNYTPSDVVTDIGWGTYSGSVDEPLDYGKVSMFSGGPSLQLDASLAGKVLYVRVTATKDGWIRNEQYIRVPVAASAGAPVESGDQLTDENRGNLSVYQVDNLADITVYGHNREQFQVFAYSDGRSMGWYTSDDLSSFVVDVASLGSGDHKLAVVGADGVFYGWVAVTGVDAPGNPDPGNPDPSNPDPSNPDPSNPGGDQPAGDTPAGSTPSGAKTAKLAETGFDGGPVIAGLSATLLGLVLAAGAWIRRRIRSTDV